MGVRIHRSQTCPSSDPQTMHGAVLYMTHHFTAEELVNLLEAAGFAAVTVHTARETSSRRPDEAASFHYLTCRRA